MAKRFNGEIVVNTILGAGTEFTGDLVAKDTARVDGTIRGNIQSEGMIIIGTTGHVEGNIFAQEVSVAGMIKGDIHAKSRLEVLASAHIEGNITTKSLSIEENAILQGVCNMNQIEKES